MAALVTKLNHVGVNGVRKMGRQMLHARSRFHQIELVFFYTTLCYFSGLIIRGEAIRVVSPGIPKPYYKASLSGSEITTMGNGIGGEGTDCDIYFGCSGMATHATYHHKRE